jgi:hypothetical protein
MFSVTSVSLPRTKLLVSWVCCVVEVLLIEIAALAASLQLLCGLAANRVFRVHLCNFCHLFHIKYHEAQWKPELCWSPAGLQGTVQRGVTKSQLDNDLLITILHLLNGCPAQQLDLSLQKREGRDRIKTGLLHVATGTVLVGQQEQCRDTTYRICSSSSAL